MRKLFVGLIILALTNYFGCAVFKSIAVKEKKARAKKEAAVAKGMVEDFDPLSLEDEDILPELEQEEKAITTESRRADQYPVKSKSTEASEAEMISGYRVQICALSDEQAARDIMREAILKFDVGVYMVYHSPYYKIRIGDCKMRYEAEELQRLAIEKGFKDAWVVKEMVYKNPEK